MLTPHTRRGLTVLGNALLVELGAELVRQKHVADGRLLRSLRATVHDDPLFIILRLSFLKYGGFVDTGRQPGKMPPVDEIKRWVQQKGIASTAKDVDSIAWAIAVSMKKNGIPNPKGKKVAEKRLGWFSGTIKKKEPMIQTHVVRAVGRDLQADLDNFIKLMNQQIKRQ